MTWDLSVDISSSSPILKIEVSTNEIGKLVASMCDDEQVAVLRSMMLSLKSFPAQNDYISIELEKPENKDIRDWLLYLAKGE